MKRVSTQYLTTESPVTLLVETNPWNPEKSLGDLERILEIHIIPFLQYLQ